MFAFRSKFVAGSALAAVLLGGTATAIQSPGGPVRVSAQGPDGDDSYTALWPAVAHNTATNEYLTVWAGSTLTTADEFEIYARRQGSDGSPVGGPIRVTNIGLDGDAGSAGFNPDVAYNSAANEYLVVWLDVRRVPAPGGDESASTATQELRLHVQRLGADGLAIGDATMIAGEVPRPSFFSPVSSPAVVYNPTANEYLVAWQSVLEPDPPVSQQPETSDTEIVAQRLDAQGAEIGTETRVSDMGPDGNPSFGAAYPALAYNSVANEYLVSWVGNDDVAPLSSEELEIYVQRLSATASEIGTDSRISSQGPEGDRRYATRHPAVAYNPSANEYLVTWTGTEKSPDDSVREEYQIYAQRLGADGAELGTDVRISDVGGIRRDGYFTPELTPSVAYSTAAGEYLVTWSGDVITKPRKVDPQGSFNDSTEEHHPEIFVQRLSETASEIGADARISQVGNGGRAVYPDVVYGTATNEYLVGWVADAGDPPDLDEIEIYTQRLALDYCASAPPAPVPSAGSGKLTLTPAQLKINQRIGQAAIRRAEAIQQWLDGGIVNSDLCGGALTEAQLDAGVQVTIGTSGPSPRFAAPRPLAIAPADPKSDVTFQVTRSQLRINQRVYAAALRRANALRKRVNGGLTGGDIVDRQLAADRFSRGLIPGARTPAASPAGASQTVPAPATKSAASFTPTLKQLRINQKIAQAAVRRTNTLRRTLATGLTGDNFADGSITAVDFAP